MERSAVKITERQQREREFVVEFADFADRAGFPLRLGFPGDHALRPPGHLSALRRRAPTDRRAPGVAPGGRVPAPGRGRGRLRPRGALVQRHVPARPAARSGEGQSGVTRDMSESTNLVVTSPPSGFEIRAARYPLLPSRYRVERCYRSISVGSLTLPDAASGCTAQPIAGRTARVCRSCEIPTKPA